MYRSYIAEAEDLHILKKEVKDTKDIGLVAIGLITLIVFFTWLGTYV